MSLTRCALLISNPGERDSENYCKGVYVDVANYKRVLTSSEGGAWDTTEIQHFDRPSITAVTQWINESNAYDYVFIMFTGHGVYSKSADDRILELKRNELLPSLALNRGAKRRTVILDCCQQVHEEAIMEKLARSIVFANVRPARTSNRTNCRNHFDALVQKSPFAIIRTTSCAIGEISTDDDTRGGRYNGSLIAHFDDWVHSQMNDRFAASPADSSIVAAHDAAASKTRKLSENQQNPTIEKPRSGPYFPLAVFA